MIGIILSFFLVAGSVGEVDSQINTLKEKKMGYEKKALFHRSQADRLQFMEGELASAKKHWNLAEYYSHCVEETQKKIDELEKSK